MTIFDMGKNSKPDEIVPIETLPSSVSFKDFEKWFWREILRLRSGAFNRIPVRSKK